MPLPPPPSSNEMKEVRTAFNEGERKRKRAEEEGKEGVLGGSLKRQLTYYIRVSKTYIGNVIIHIQIRLSHFAKKGGEKSGSEGGRGAR